MAQGVFLLKEWAPLTDLFNQLPSKTGALFSQDIKLTCVDVLPEFLVLGSNVGVIFWYDRKTKELKRLRCENAAISITCVKVVSTVEYMVACGNQNGNITIFSIPKNHPDSLPENLKPKLKQVERYTVTDMHSSSITALEWSKNGMRLFSGDKSGCVVSTEIDFYMHICKSIEILNESYEIVQLSYAQQRLLISTTFRSIICEKEDKWKVSQVGKKDRKVLGNFGGLIHRQGLKPTDNILYCTRPGLRVWMSDIDGNVQKTLLFKDLLFKECPQVSLLNPISKNLQELKPQREPSFGYLLPFCDKLLVTYSYDVLYVLNPQEMTMLATVGHLRSILDVATCKDEIFILEEERSLLRISFRPETQNDASPLSSTTNPISLSVNPLKEISSKIQATTNLFLINHQTNLNQDDLAIHTDENLVLNAEEAKESPKENYKKFEEIGKQEFEDKILFKKSKSRRKTSKMTQSTVSLSSNSSEEKELSYTRPTLMNLSSIGVLPDLRSPESINNDIEYKEKILADVLNFDKVKISLDSVQKSLSTPKASNDIFDSQDIMASDTVQNPQSASNNTHFNQVSSSGKVFEESFNSTSHPARSLNGVRKKENTSILSTPIYNIPNEWNLRDVKIEKKNVVKEVVKERKPSTNSLSDWEIV